MQDFKNKLYNYETPPPEGTWDHIEEVLNNQKAIKILGYHKNKFLFYGATAAASIIIIFLGSVFFKKNTHSAISKASVEKENQLIGQKIIDSINLNRRILNSIINNPNEKEEIISDDSILRDTPSKYLTITNPDGQPVRISPKVATLIISADNEYPPKPVWGKEIRKWQKIMLNTTISPTSANFADLVQLAANKENRE
ncbi:MAG TPA: hypothetical protein VMU83_00350 [Hanamia sp.]|nr:hypothetical protein [Hanamia sp.]